VTCAEHKAQSPGPRQSARAKAESPQPVAISKPQWQFLMTFNDKTQNQKPKTKKLFFLRKRHGLPADIFVWCF
jgi:hypothetical protein